MSRPFDRSLHYVDARTTGGVVLRFAALTICFTLWSVWLLFARVPNYQQAASARLEDDNSVDPITSLVSGKVVAIHAKLGEQVQAGQILLDIDATPQRLELTEEKTRKDAAHDQLAIIRDEIATSERKLQEATESRRASMEEGKARERAALVSARVAAEEAAQDAKLFSEGLISQAEYDKAKGEVERLQAEAQALNHALAQVSADGLAKEDEIKAEITRLQAQLTQVRGTEATQSASVNRLAGEIERRQVTAPGAGTLGEMEDLRPGAYVREGERLGAIVPSGKLRAVADFDPSSALGWIKPGQRARIRLTGFPWAQYGFIPASVTNVASEIRDGKIRVEMAIDPGFRSSIRLEHGLPGTVEVEVERVSPATLILRAAGKLVDSK
ncbi:MAG TPA: HlyD family efflux transporter periplasmic adaptor subunit [Blastocatellia bacterium]|nr:HlyD family efflux transporter periplasmic adaptor subunit [Blastocatellia bacterium]